MAMLTCINHPDRIWNCKDIAVSNGRYNGMRNIFYFGRRTVDDDFVTDYTLPECSCPASDLRVLPNTMGD
jgi:hypothetical protein